MEGDSVMPLEQAYLERCGQLTCANFCLGVRHCFPYSPKSPLKQLSEAGDSYY